MADPTTVWWYVTTRRWTCAVETDNWKPFVIRATPPLLRGFRGQPLRHLVKWARHDKQWGMLRLPD
jgi:hypothetical protein